MANVGFASMIMMGSVLISRVIGLAREMVIAYVGGTGGSVDAYQAAFAVPEILNHIVASGFLSITFIPIFSACINRQDTDEGWKILSIIFSVIGTLLIVLICICVVFSPELVSLMVPGIRLDPGRFHQAVTMTRIIMPAQFFFFAGGLFMAVQFAHKQFWIPALAPLIYNAGIISGGLLLGSSSGMQGFSWGVLGGAFAGNFLLQYIGARRTGMKLFPIFAFRHPEFIRYLLLTAPLMLGLTMTFSTEILFRFFGSLLDTGSIAALNYALRIMFILVGLFGQAVGVASYPYMADLAATGNITQLNHLLNKTVRLLLLVIPVSVLFIVLRFEIVSILFRRGDFGIESTRLTAQVLAFILAGTFAFCAQTVVTRGYYAIQNTWFPAVISTLAVAASLPILFFLAKLMGAQGVALGLSISAVIQSVLLFELWNKKTNNKEGRTTYLFFFKLLSISIGIGFVLAGLHMMLKSLIPDAGFGSSMIICILTGIVFLLLITLSSRIFKIEEILFLIKKI